MADAIHRPRRVDGPAGWSWVLCSALLAGLTLVPTLFQPAHADQLRGQLTGLAEPNAHVDLLVRFFNADEQRLAERQFEGVRLVRGVFELSVDASTVPAAAASIQIALRPAARHYAAFQSIEPRRPIRRLHPGTRIASTSTLRGAEIAATTFDLFVPPGVYR